MLKASYLLIFAAVFSLAICQVQLPCDSFLRNFPSLSAFFQHCECDYGNWTDVIPHANTSAIQVPLSECRSGLKIAGIRYQYATGNRNSCNTTAGCAVCADRQEAAFVCKTDCHYMNGSDITPVENAATVRVPRNQCESGYAIPAQQYLVAIEGYECPQNQCRQCEDEWRAHYICEPPLEEVLIVALDLGDSGQNTETLRPPPTDGYVVLSESTPPPPNPCETREVCADSSHTGRRSIVDEEKPPPSVLPEPKPLPVDPIPFDYTKHRGRYRRQTQSSSYCDSPDSVRHVMFMLDTSGSIGRVDFKKMTNALSKLVRHFCRPIKIAAMVFNDDHFVEFCFDCFDNNCDGRRAARDKIKSIPYRGGWTHTASATQCACNHVLTSSCGFDFYSTRACLDVVYITDGHSNDPELEVCSTVDCLYNTPNTDLSVFVFGIGRGVNDTELNCIARKGHRNNRNNPANAIFSVDSFQHFADAIEKIGTKFADPDYQEIIRTINPNGPDCFSSNPNTAGGISHDDCSNSEIREY